MTLLFPLPEKENSLTSNKAKSGPTSNKNVQWVVENESLEIMLIIFMSLKDTM